MTWTMQEEQRLDGDLVNKKKHLVMCLLLY